MSERRICVLVVAAGVVSAASAQSASISVVHNDPDGIVAPGEVVRITATLDWTNFLLLSKIEGDLLASPNLGSASNNAFAHQGAYLNPPVSIDPGSPDGGSIVDVVIDSGNVGWLFGPPIPAPWGSNQIHFLEYDWTAPTTLGVVEFNWTGAAASPDPVFFTAAGYVTLPTTYTGASLTVIPAPASAALLAPLAIATVRRRER
ncbi:MAG: hypothetical protein KDA05_12455 [Phycisphaerales bacterium]|nr:hypothetical protein [Phycisphaerales bacterium]MCB9840048.1 hypothetical protein [Phycisphaeraceae bacterium]